MGIDDDAPAEGQDAGRDAGLLFGGGVALGAAVLALIWVVASLVGNGSSDDDARAVGGSVGVPLSDVSSSRSLWPSGLERCTGAIEALDAPLRAAAPAMDQWEVHIGAMNKLVVGAITLQQATAFWDQTRIGAQQRIAGFRAAVRTMRREGVDCPSPDLLGSKAAPVLRTCARQVHARLDTLHAARTAVRTWEMHVQDMERLRAGTLSPARASAMWLSMWRLGQGELDTYRTARRTVTALGDCRTPAGGNAVPSAVPSSMPSLATMDGMH